MLNPITGVPGAGKTTLLTCMAWGFRDMHILINNRLRFVDVYGKPVPGDYNITKFSSLSEIKGITEGKTVILGDEIWQQVDSFEPLQNSKKKAKYLMQARKTGEKGHDTHVYSTVQDLGLFMARVRRVSSINYMPRIIQSTPEGMPLTLSVEWYDLQDWRKRGTDIIHTLITDEVCHRCNHINPRNGESPCCECCKEPLTVVCIPNSYESDEVIGEAQSEKADGILEMVKKYKDLVGSDMNKADMSDYIYARQELDCDPQPKAMCRSIAGLIKSGRLDEFLKSV